MRWSFTATVKSSGTPLLVSNAGLYAVGVGPTGNNTGPSPDAICSMRNPPRPVLPGPLLPLPVTIQLVAGPEKAGPMMGLLPAVMVSICSCVTRCALPARVRLCKMATSLNTVGNNATVPVIMHTGGNTGNG